MRRLKCALILLDGLGDRAYDSLGHRTPLQAAHTPHLDRLAAEGACGLFHAARLGEALPSENAHFSLFGYSPDEFPGRGPLEALGADIPIGPSDVAILAHFAHLRPESNSLMLINGELQSNIEEAAELFAAVSGREFEGLTFEFIRTHRLFGLLMVRGGASPFITDTDPILPGKLLIEPEPWQQNTDDANARRTARALKAYLMSIRQTLAHHPINQARQQRGEEAANGMVTQRSGRLLRDIPTFQQRYGLRGLMIASGVVLHGLARYIGLDRRKVKDTDRPDNDLAERIALAHSLMGEYDFIHVHTKLPDVAAHTKSPQAKVEAIEHCDRGIGAAIEPLRNDPDVLIVVTSDHSTPSGGELIHCGEPVPLLMHGQGLRRDGVQTFDEISAAAGALSLVRGEELVYLILNNLDRAKLQGLMDTPHNQPYWPGDYRAFVVDDD